MERDTAEAVLAHMAYRIVEHRREDLAFSIARSLLAANGSVTADEVAARLDAEFVPPSQADILDLITRKCESAVDVHEREALFDVDAVHRAERGVEKAEARLAERQARLDAAIRRRDDGAAGGRAEAARVLLDVARELGGDGSRASTASDAAANAQVAEAVGEAIAGGT